jgi:two-component system sensor histidine kinase AlgZ
MLRALLALHAVLAVGAGLGAAGWAGWWFVFAAGSAVALPGLLAWLVSGCALQRARLPWAARWRTAGLVLLGALNAVWPWLGWQALQAADAPAVQTLAVALAGAGFAAAFAGWMEQQARQRAPAAARARLAELQSRIRPHFLFNTLNTAIALVRLDPSKAEAVLEDLAELFRAALAEAGPDATATLAEEIDLARRYLAIEQLRFGERLDVQWELDPAADAARLPPLLLQPLLENAVRHGVEPAAAGGQVRVRTRVRRGQAEVTVVNTVPDAASRPGQGLALQNVRERLQLMHDVAADFQVRREGAMFRVDIALPL